MAEAGPMRARPSRPPLIASERTRLTLTFSGPPLAVDQTSEESSSASAPEVVIERPQDDDGRPDGWTRESARRCTPAPRVARARAAPSASSRPDRGRRASTSGSLPAVVDESDAYRLIERARPSLSLDHASEVAERYGLGDFTGALHAAELWLGADPDNAEAARYAASCRAQLERFYQARLGSFERIAHVAVVQSELRWLGLDHRAGFFLSRVDGQTTVEELLDLSAMPRLESLKTLVELLESGAVRLD